MSAPPVSFERRLAGPAGSSDTFLKRLQMRNGGILGGPGAHDPDVAIRIIDCLNPIDPMSRDDAICPSCNMTITSQRMQLNQRLTRPIAERGLPTASVLSALTTRGDLSGQGRYGLLPRSCCLSIGLFSGPPSGGMRPREATMRLRMAMFLVAGSVGLAGCTAEEPARLHGPNARLCRCPGYGYDAGAYGYANGVPVSTYVAPPPDLRIRRPRLLRGAGLCGWGICRGPGWSGHDEDSRRRARQNNAAEPQQARRGCRSRSRRTRRCIASRSSKCGYLPRQVQEGDAAKYQQQVQQNQALVQQNAARYQQQVQQNTAIYQRQLLEAQQRKALGQQ